MKSIFFFIFIFVSFGNLFSGSICEYSYDHSKTKFIWTAFKFTEKAGVNGTFDKVGILGNPKGETIKDFAHKIKFQIPVDSVNTNNPDRDAKIQKFFFGEMKSTTKIYGYFRNIKWQNESGTAELVLKMNNQERSVPVSFILKDNKNLELRGTIDLFKWGAHKSIESLNKECNALHTGKDGVSKLWNEVDILLTTELNYNCK
jgi:hypothetical protein